MAKASFQQHVNERDHWDEDREVDKQAKALLISAYIAEKKANADKYLRAWQEFLASPDIQELAERERATWLKRVGDWLLTHCKRERDRTRYLAMAMDTEGLRRQGIEIDTRPQWVGVERPESQNAVPEPPPAEKTHRIDDKDLGRTS